jgi:membrane glycosyltransferase
VNRVHFALGILAYLASPLWLAFLIVSAVVAARGGFAVDGSAAPAGFAAYVPWSAGTQAGWLALFTLGVLFLPKILAVLDLRGRPAEVAGFGGWGDLVGGAVLETLVFTLLAPVLMLFHSTFVVLAMCRNDFSWGTQRRGAAGEAALAESVAAHWPHTALGLVAAALVNRFAPGLLFWMSPLFAGLIAAIPLSYFTGSLAAGRAFRREGLLRTPEEHTPPPELGELAARLAARRTGPPPLPELAADYGLLQAVLDPYVNAVHVSLLRTKDDAPPAHAERFAGLRATLLREGPAALAPRDRLALLMDLDSMNALHAELWASPAAELAPWWQLALQHYGVIAPVPDTAFSRKERALAAAPVLAAATATEPTGSGKPR